jgi:tetratricopeptide (TPR) repeat protein
MRLWRRVTELADALPDDEESALLRLYSRMLQLEYAWRLGIEPAAFDALVAEATELASGAEDLTSLTLLKLLTTARPGVAETARAWVAAVDEALAVRAAGAYAHMCAGDLDRVERYAAEILALTEGNPDLGAGVVIASPRAWARTARAMAQRERGNVEEATRLLEEALAEASDRHDLELESWALGTKAQLLADRGDLEGALAIGLRNREITERLGDVFSRTIALTSLGYVRVEAGEFEAALADVERAAREFGEAMGSGGEMEAWRATLRGRALLGAGRTAEALAQAEESVAVSRRREMGWQLPAALHLLAEARAAAGVTGAREALDEGERLTRSLGHAMTLRRIEAAREGLVAAPRQA